MNLKPQDVVVLVKFLAYGEKRHPLVQQPPVVGHHQLIAALELVIDQVETYIKPSGAIRPLSLNRRYTDTASLFLNCSITM